MSGGFWMAESRIVDGTDLGGQPNAASIVWAVGVGNKEIAWFLSRSDALDYCKLCNDSEQGRDEPPHP